MNQEIEYKGHLIRVRWERDEFNSEPWKESDGHGIVSDWTRRDKAPGERVLVEDRGSRRFYDIAETMKLAKRDGWGVSPAKRAEIERQVSDEINAAQNQRNLFVNVSRSQLTRKVNGRVLVAAVEADYEHLRAWCNDQWSWMCRSVRIYKSVSDTTLENVGYSDSLCGIEGTDDTIKEYTQEAFEEAKAWLDNELAESEDAACRDIETIKG